MKKNELTGFLESKERSLFTNKTILVDLANLILDFGGLGNYISLTRKISKYHPNKIYFLADASLKYRLTPEDTERYLDLIAEGIIRECPSRTQADVYLLQMGVRIPNSAILSNDSFKEFESRLVKNCEIIKFLTIDGEIYFNIDVKSKSSNKNFPNKGKVTNVSLKNMRLNSPSKISKPYWLEALYGKNTQKNKTIEIY